MDLDEIENLNEEQILDMYADIIEQNDYISGTWGYGGICPKGYSYCGVRYNPSTGNSSVWCC